MMNYEERPVVFCCGSDWLYGILTLPEHAASRGVLILVGGPQYRVGSHRQFVLLARYLAANGVPVLRFDYRGMGDSEGDARTFEDIGDDLRCAIDEFFEEVPSLTGLVIWGLCDAASAALFYAHQDTRVMGLVLLNPWVRTDQGAAQAYLKHYYLARIFTPEFWRKIRKGQFNYFESIRSLWKIMAEAFTGKEKVASSIKASPRNSPEENCCHLAPLPKRMVDGLSRFNGKLLIIISGKDLTAQEFLDLVKRSRDWQKMLASPQVSRLYLPEANHTFSRREWRDQVAVATREWIRSW